MSNVIESATSINVIAVRGHNSSNKIAATVVPDSNCRVIAATVGPDSNKIAATVRHISSNNKIAATARPSSRHQQRLSKYKKHRQSASSMWPSKMCTRSFGTASITLVVV